MLGGLVHQKHGVFSRRDHAGDFDQVQARRLRIAGGEDEPASLAVPGTDGTENIGGGGALVLRALCRVWPIGA